MITPGLPYRCADCHKVFLSKEAEWMATETSIQIDTTCPRCGSANTSRLLAFKWKFKDFWDSKGKNK